MCFHDVLCFAIWLEQDFLQQFHNLRLQALRPQLEFSILKRFEINFLGCLIFILKSFNKYRQLIVSRHTYLDKDKAELLQLNRTQFPSLGILVNKKLGNLIN